MRKLPYIPLYIGDWEQDTNTISLEAEGALIKLVFKLWKSNDKGKLVISFNQLSILLKKPQEIALKIVRELQENNVLNIEIFAEGIVNIESRRMLKDASKSMALSENGKKGGRSKKANRKPNESKSKAKVKQIADNDIDNDSEVETESKGVQGGKNFNLIFPFTSEAFFTTWQAFVNFRKELKKPFQTFSEQQAMLQMLSRYPEQTAIDMTLQSIRNGWKDIFKLKDNGKQSVNNRSAVDAVGAEAYRILTERESRNNAPGD